LSSTIKTAAGPQAMIGRIRNDRRDLVFQLIKRVLERIGALLSREIRSIASRSRVDLDGCRRPDGQCYKEASASERRNL